MNNCKVELITDVSKKTGKEYHYLKFTINGKEIPNSRTFVKETEFLFYKSLIK